MRLLFFSIVFSFLAQYYFAPASLCPFLSSWSRYISRLLRLSLLGNLWQDHPGLTCPSFSPASSTYSSLTHEANVCPPIVQSPLLIQWHVSIMLLRWECFFYQLYSRHWWCGDMCQSCVYIGSVCSLIVHSWMMIHWRVSHVSTLGVSVHWLSSRQWWSTDMFQSSVYIGNGKFTDCPVIINDLVTCVSHVSTLGMASSPTVQSSFMI